MPHHPDREHLDSFVRGLDTSGAGYLLHLLDCARCAAEVRERLAPIEQQRGALALARPIPPIDYSGLWERLEKQREQALEEIRRERQEVIPLFRQLLATPLSRWGIMIDGYRPHHVLLAESLLDYARRQ